MAEDLATLIRQTAAKVRTRDFLWSAGMATGVSVILWLFTEARGGYVLVGWAAVLAGLAIRYRLSAGREWARPVQRVVDAELGAREAELSTLRLVRGIVRALPEPLFLLDETGQIELANPAAATFAGGPVEGRHLSAFLRTPAVIGAVREVATGAERREVDFVATGTVDRHCRAFVGAMEIASGRRRILVHITDLTAERRLERLRADFIASASHELRTPLASMIGFIETLRGHAKDDPEARERFLEIMLAQAERMKRLVNDLMSLSRIELNEHITPEGAVDVAAAARDVLDGVGPIIAASGKTVRLECDAPAGVWIRGDRDELLQVVQNLVDNALKYAGDVDEIEISVGRGAPPPFADRFGREPCRAGDTPAQVAARTGRAPDELVYIQVRDRGVGIDRSDLPRLTERFYRVDVQQSRAQGGTGLGLAIVKHIINRHGGGFQIESVSGAGSAFTCFFANVEPAADELPLAAQ